MQASADRESALPHVPQAVAVHSPLVVEPHAIISDLKDDSRIFGKQAEPRVTRAGMPLDVPQRIGSDVERGFPTVRIKRRSGVWRD